MARMRARRTIPACEQANGVSKHGGRLRFSSPICCQQKLGHTGILLLSMLFAVACGGCSDETTVELAPVSGRVTFDSRPLVNATVTFMPESTGELAPTSSGTTDSEGRYTLEAPLGSGAMPGRHKVMISKYSSSGTGDSDAGGEPPNEIPSKYNVNTELSIEVPASGRDDADFTLLK